MKELMKAAGGKGSELKILKRCDRTRELASTMDMNASQGRESKTSAWMEAVTRSEGEVTAEAVQNQHKQYNATDELRSPAEDAVHRTMFRWMRQKANDRRRCMMTKPTATCADKRSRSEIMQAEPSGASEPTRGKFQEW